MFTQSPARRGRIRFSRMTKWMALSALLCLSWPSKGQDISWMLEKAPLISAILARTIEKAPAFSAAVEVHVSSRIDPASTTAAALLQSQRGQMRWDLKLSDIKSAQLTPNTRAAVRQLNGERMLLLTRLDTNSNYLLLPGAKAYLQEELPGVRLSKAVRAGAEEVGPYHCVRERLTSRHEGTTNHVTVWRADSLKGFPVQVQIVDGSEIFRIQFRDVKFRSIPREAFGVPAGLTRYTSFEDLTQSVLLEKLKRRMGLE